MKHAACNPTHACLLINLWKTALLFSSLLLLTPAAQSQETKLSTGVLGSWDSYDFDFQETGTNNAFEATTAFSFGVIAQYHITERIAPRMGVFYTQKGYSLDYDFQFINPGDPSIPRTSELSVRYIGIPLLFTYYLIPESAFRLSSSAGVVPEFLVGDEEVLEFEDGSERESLLLNQNLTSVLFSAQWNIGVEYHFAKRFFLAAEPYARYGFNTIDPDVVGSNTLSYGAILSFNYKWK